MARHPFDIAHFHSCIAIRTPVMAPTSTPLSARRTPRPVWKPPVWLLILNAFGMSALGLGLILHYAPESAVAQALPAEARLLLLTFGGATFALCWLALVLSILSLRRR
jgi:uncharacterized protein (TIGR03382 family)